MGELVCFCGSRVMKNKVDIWVLLAYVLFFKMKLTKVGGKTRIDPIHTIETNIIFHVFEDRSLKSKLIEPSKFYNEIFSVNHLY